MQIEEIDESKIKEMIAEMDDDDIEEIIGRIEKFNYNLNIKCRKRMKRTGFLCLMCFFINVLLCLIYEKITVFSVISMIICLFCALFDFRQSAKYEKRAQEYKETE